MDSLSTVVRYGIGELHWVMITLGMDSMVARLFFGNAWAISPYLAPRTFRYLALQNMDKFNSLLIFWLVATLPCAPLTAYALK